MTTDERKRQLKRRKFVSLIIGAGLLFGAAYGGIKYDINHLSLSEVQLEIDIHSGIAETPDGHHIDPYSEHGCEVPYDGRDFEVRLADRMYEEGYDQKTVEAAVEKFHLQCDGDLKAAKEIKLNTIEALSKETGVRTR